MFVFHYITRVEVSGDQQTGISQQGECVQRPLVITGGIPKMILKQYWLSQFVSQMVDLEFIVKGFGGGLLFIFRGIRWPEILAMKIVE